MCSSDLVHREIEETARIELSASVDRLVTAQAQADILRQQLLQVSTYNYLVIMCLLSLINKICFYLFFVILHGRFKLIPISK